MRPVPQIQFFPLATLCPTRQEEPHQLISENKQRNKAFIL